MRSFFLISSHCAGGCSSLKFGWALLVIEQVALWVLLHQLVRLDSKWCHQGKTAVLTHRIFWLHVWIKCSRKDSESVRLVHQWFDPTWQLWVLWLSLAVDKHTGTINWCLAHCWLRSAFIQLCKGKAITDNLLMDYKLIINECLRESSSQISTNHQVWINMFVLVECSF